MNCKPADWKHTALRYFELLSKEKYQNKRYREALVKLQGFVKRGENECNIKQLIMKLTNEALEGEK